MRLLPNLVTLARIALTPWIGLALANRDMQLALPLLFAAGMSDALDGWLARRYRWQTAAGAYLDPIADKLLLATAFLGLGFGGAVAWWVVGLVFGRDILILLCALYALHFTKIRAFPPSVWGKLSTFFQLLLAGGCVLRQAWPDCPLLPLLPAILWAAVAATAWSGAHYGWSFARRLAETAD